MVITGNKARASLSAHGAVKGAYLELSKVKAVLKKQAKKAGAPAPQVVLIQDQRTGQTVQAVARADLVAAGLAKKEDLPQGDAHKAQQEADARKRAAVEARAKEETSRRTALLMHVRQVAAQRARDAFDLRLVAAAALSGVDWHDKSFLALLHGLKDVEALKRQIDHMDVVQLTALVMDCAIVDDVRVHTYSLHTKPGPLLALANHYGIDANAVMAAWRADRATASAGAGAEDDEASAALDPSQAGGASPAGAGEEQTDEAGCAGEMVEEEARPHPFAQEGTY